ncbi:MAG: 4Fe-4S binding protein, partial [Oscillospiraceae bacterium]|nr:4Fe-4S binding protein [Oscillospiraceae bacterium]
YCLEQYEDMPMGEEDQELCRADGVTIHAGWGQTAIDTEDGRATGIHFRRCLSVKNAEGRFDPQFDDNDTAFESCTTVLYCIGQKVEWKELLKDTKVAFRPNGIAIADPVTLQTAEPDIFVGGDVYTGQKFVVDALAAGREGAVSLHRFVNEGQSLTIHRNTRHFASLNKDDIVLPDEAKNKPRRAVKGVDAAKARTMHDERLIFTEEQIKSEASRCLSCGRSVVDTNKCLGCGMCTVQCKFDAIHLIRNMGDAYSRMIPAEDKFKAIAAYLPKRTVKILKHKASGKAD